MSDYTKTTNFGAKDALPSGDSAKIVKGQEIDDEFDAIATAVATKVDEPSGTVGNMLKIASGGQVADTGYPNDAFPIANIDLNGGTAETAIADDDEILIYDTSATANRKMTVLNIKTGAILQTVIDTDGEDDQNVTSVMAWDDSIPQITEGEEKLTVNITPSDANNLIRVTATVYVAANTAPMSVAMFKTGTANALRAGGTDSTELQCCTLMYQAASGGTSQQTYSIRVGTDSASTACFNSTASNRVFGGVVGSFLMAEEIRSN